MLRPPINSYGLRVTRDPASEPTVCWDVELNLHLPNRRVSGVLLPRIKERHDSELREMRVNLHRMTMTLPQSMKIVPFDGGERPTLAVPSKEPV